MEWFSTLYEPDQGPLFEERALNLARDAATLRHFAQRAPLGGVGGDPEGLRGALDGVLQRFPPEVGRGARLRAAEFDSNKPAQRAATLLSGTAKCFVAAWAGLRAGGRGALPHVAAAALPAAEAAAAGGDGDPLVLSIGDVLAIDGGEGSTYYGVVVQLWDPQAAQATYARGVAARLWDAAEFEAAGQHAAAAQLAEGEVALSSYFDFIRPGSVQNKLELVPACWRDPSLPSGRELFFSRFLDWPQNSLRPLDFGFAADGSASSAAQLLTWLRHRHIASNSSWQRELDFFADAVYWAFKHALITERAAVARGRLPDITVTINRNWLLLLPPSILNTAEHFYSQATGHQFRLLIKTKEDAEAFLGPSDTLDASPTCYGLVHRKQRAGADPNNYYLSLPIELLFNPQRPGETDLLHMHCHMFKMHLANMLWDTRTVIGPIQQ